jgi:hypothetical protein
MRNESSIAEFFDSTGSRLFTPVVAGEWDRPSRVALIELRPRNFLRKEFGRGPFSKYGSELHIFADQEANKPSKAKPSSDILERFLNLANATDAVIHKFTTKYGGLNIFTRSQRHVSIEYCEVWRYFARSMYAFLRIATQCYAGHAGSQKDWDEIGSIPKVMLQRFENSDKDLPLEGEFGWLAMTFFIRRGKDRDRAMLVRLLNGLMDLGRVRPWVLWPPYGIRPRMIYSLAPGCCLFSRSNSA